MVAPSQALGGSCGWPPAAYESVLLPAPSLPCGDRPLVCRDWPVAQCGETQGGGGEEQPGRDGEGSAVASHERGSGVSGGVLGPGGYARGNTREDGESKGDADLLGGVEQGRGDARLVRVDVVDRGLGECHDAEAEAEREDEHGRGEVQPVAGVDADGREPQRGA